MRKYYTRPCNFYYGNYAKKLIQAGKALPLAGNQKIAFDQLEIFQRKKKVKLLVIFILFKKSRNLMVKKDLQF
tara:strand:+ start:1396 stop:1614 length:219 start_codon:yes stop_codon:yes gene_type:complete